MEDIETGRKLGRYDHRDLPADIEDDYVVTETKPPARAGSTA